MWEIFLKRIEQGVSHNLLQETLSQAFSIFYRFSLFSFVLIDALITFKNILKNKFFH